MIPAPPDPSGLPNKGDLIAGKYQVEDILGQGGMGVVVAARHLALRQRVAIKFLLPAGLRLPGARERFLREAQAAAAIQSEHVARVLDIGTLETGAPYLVMEYLAGHDLGRVLKSRGPLPIPDAVDLILQASEAIGEAHALGIVHRDLKPQNLFVISRNGAPFVKVLDFGLSKVPTMAGEAPEASLTATNLVIGSPQYMSPEQIRGLKHADARTDIWALGVILYQLLTGHRPFLGDSLIAICASIAADVPPPLQTYRPEMPAQLDALVQSCLEKDPARRVQSVADLVRGLSWFNSPRASLTSNPRDSSLVNAPPSSSQASIPAIVATIPAATTLQARTTARLSAWEQTQPRARQRVLALVTFGSAVAVAGILTFGLMLGLRRNRGEAAINAPAPVNASPPIAAPVVVPKERVAMPPSTVSMPAEPTAAPVAPTSAPRVAPVSTPPSTLQPDAGGSKVASTKAIPVPAVTGNVQKPAAEKAELSVFAMPEPAVTAKPPVTAKPAATVKPAATAKPDAGPAPKSKAARDLFESFD